MIDILTERQYEVIQKISKIIGCDWFSISKRNNKDYIYDMEEGEVLEAVV